jgi:hypothetical protein
VTAGWRRADGSRARHYVCPNVRGATGVCDAPRVDAGAVEPFFVAPLHDFLVDLDAGIAARAAQTDRDRELFAKGVQEQRAELARLGRRAEAACAQHDRLLDQGDDELADTRRGARTRVSVRRLPRCPRGPRPVGGCRGRGRPAEPATLSQVQATALDSALTHVLRRRT